MIRLLSVYRHPENSIDILYELLKERDLTLGISHKELPKFEDHKAFVLSNPYQCWYLVIDKDVILGSVYLSRQREIGIFIFKEFQGKGYGTQAVEALMQRWPGHFLANVNPKNTASVKFFERLGAKMIQHTYSL